MSYTSNYNLNIRLSNLESRINSGVPTSSDLADILLNGNSAGASDLDMNNNDILNCNNLQTNTINGNPVGVTPTLQQVLTAGNDANLSIDLKNNLITPTSTNSVFSSGMSIIGNTNGSVGISSGNAVVNGTASAVISTAVATSASFGLSAGAFSTPPLFQPANTNITLNSTPSTASVSMASGGQLVNAKNIALDLNGLTHNSSDGTGDFTITTNGDLLLSSDNLNMTSTTLNIPNSSATIKQAFSPSSIIQTDTSTIPTATRTLTIGSNAIQISNSLSQQSVYIQGDNGTLQLNRKNSGDCLFLYNSGTGINPTDNTAGIQFVRLGRNGIAGDIIGRQTYFSPDYLGNPIPFCELQGEVRNNSVGNTDGAIALRGLINGTMTDFFRVNGADSENNCYLPLDMNGQAIKTNSGSLTISSASSTGTGTITLQPKASQSILIPSASDSANDFIRINPQVSANSQQILMTATDAGTGFTNSINLLNFSSRPFIELKADFGGAINKSIQIDANGSGSSNNRIYAYDGQNNLPFQIVSEGITNGSIELKPKDTTGDLIFTGTNIESGTAGGNSGQHLRIKLNGTYYKIQLLND